MTLESIKDKINEVGRLLDGNHVADAFVILENIAQEEQNYKATDNLNLGICMKPDICIGRHIIRQIQ